MKKLFRALALAVCAAVTSNAIAQEANTSEELVKEAIPSTLTLSFKVEYCLEVSEDGSCKKGPSIYELSTLEGQDIILRDIKSKPFVRSTIQTEQPDGEKDELEVFGAAELGLTLTLLPYVTPDNELMLKVMGDVSFEKDDAPMLKDSLGTIFSFSFMSHTLLTAEPSLQFSWGAGKPSVKIYAKF